MSLRAPVLVSLVILALGACGDDPAPSSPLHDGGGVSDADVGGGDGGDPRADGGGDAGSQGDSGASDAGEPRGDGGPGTRVRIMAANTTSGSQQSYEAPGIHIFKGLAPDVALVQEMNYASGGPRALVDAAFGTSFSFYVEPSGSIPNGVVSRYPILESGSWTDASVSDRGFAWARIDVPGDVDLWAVSIHLLTSSAGARSTEAKQLAQYVQAKVPAQAYVVVGGDLNLDGFGEQALTDLRAVVATDAPHPVDQAGNANTSINRNHPHDGLFASPGLEAQRVPVAIAAASFADGLVFDSRVYTPLADVSPVAAGDSGATGMQHMAVVKDFVIR